MALRAMNQMNVDIGFLMETKLTDGIHMRQSLGYQVYATLARPHSQGGVALFFHDLPQWPNVISCQLVTGQHWIPVVRAYIFLADESTLEFIRQATDSLPQWCKPLLLGDLKVNLADLLDHRAHAVAADLATICYCNSGSAMAITMDTPESSTMMGRWFALIATTFWAWIGTCS
jgi:hypothetical protein